MWREEHISALGRATPITTAAPGWFSLADVSWLLGSPLPRFPASPLLRTRRRVKMLLSVPPRTGINPYNGYAGKNAKKVSDDACALLLPKLSELSVAVRSRRAPEPLARLSCSALESGSRATFELCCVQARPALSAFCRVWSLHCSRRYVVACGSQFGFVRAATRSPRSARHGEHRARSVLWMLASLWGTSSYNAEKCVQLFRGIR